MKASIYSSLKIFLLMTLLTGIIYPLFITLIGQVAFPFRANGSLIMQGNQLIGSDLIGQKFTSSKYFQSRPSATDYNPLPSGASNLSITSKVLRANVKRESIQFDSMNHLTTKSIPSEMVYSSASGLDPHISIQSANLQADRIGKVRNLSIDKLKHLILSLAENRQLGFLGEPRINVLRLNLELDKLK